MARVQGCPLCDGTGGVLVARTPLLRVIRAVEDAGFPAFYRVVWDDHVPEFSQLPAAQRRHCMDAVVLVEEALRRHLRPHKINLAALGNAVPHLHWHVIARHTWDSHFPAPIWSAAQRQAPAEALQAVAQALPVLERDLAQAIGRLDPGLPSDGRMGGADA